LRLQEIADRLSKHLDHFQQGESGWRLEQVALKFSLDLEAEAGVVIARAKTRAGQYFPGRDRVGTDSASTWVILHYFVTVYRFHVELRYPTPCRRPIRLPERRVQ